MMPLLHPLAVLLARALPAPWAYALARLVARLCWAADGARRCAVLANLTRVAPELDPRGRHTLGRRMFENFAESLVDGYRARANARPRVVIEGDEGLRAAIAGGEGVLLWSAHLGNWELAAAELARRGFDVSAIARPQTVPALERWFARRRRATGVRVVARCPLAIEARRVLRRHGLLALLGDRRFGGQGRAVPLFGLPARLPAAPLALARRTGARLIPGFVVREGQGKYRVRLEPAIESRDDAALLDLAQALERNVRAHPDQWFVFERVWDEPAVGGA
jgi:KDO2-lipid IV(A) lauroyltransferase